MSLPANRQISRSEEFTDNSADSFVVSDFSAAGQDYLRLTFMRHIYIPTEFPSSPEEAIKMEFYAEALQAVTLPLSVATEMARIITAAAEPKNVHDE